MFRNFTTSTTNPFANKIITIPIDDNKKFSIKEYRLKIYTDIHKRKKELRKKKMLQEQLYYQKKKSAMGYSTHYGSGYPKKESSKEQEYSRPSTTHTKGHGGYKRTGTAKYSSTSGTHKTAADREKYKKYYHSKTYKM